MCAMHLLGLDPSLSRMFARLAARGIEVPRDDFAAWPVEQVYAAAGWAAADAELGAELPDFLIPYRRSETLPPKLKSPPKKQPGANPTATSNFQSRRLARIKVAFEPNDRSRVAWQTLVRDGADVERIRNFLIALLGPGGCAQTDDGPICWRVNGSEIELWLDEESPPKHLADFTTIQLVRAAEQIYGILPPRNKSADRTAKSASPEKEPGNSSLRELPRSALVPCPWNSRKNFDTEALAQLAESFKLHGLLEPLLVRPAPEGNQFQILAGERRWRASELAGLDVVPCRILFDLTDVAAKEITLVENLEREQLDPVEEAEALAQLLKSHGGTYTETELAERLKRSQAWVSHRVRLLRLPESLRARISRGEITATMARDVAPLADLPEVMAELEAEINRDAEGVRRIWPEDLVGAADRVGRRINRLNNVRLPNGNGKWWKLRRKITPELTKQLDIRDVDGAQIAFNVTLFDELVLAEIAKEELKQQRQQSREDQEVEPSQHDDPEAENRKAEAAEKRIEKRINRYLVEWYQQVCSLRMETCDWGTVERVILASAQFDIRRNHNAMRFAAEELKLKGLGNGNLWQEVWRPKYHNMEWEHFTRAYAAAWIREPISYTTWSIDDLLDLSKRLGVDVTKDWRCDREFLDLHSTSQLGSLAAEWKLIAIGEKKGDRIDKILEANANKPFPAPKSIVKHKLTAPWL